MSKVIHEISKIMDKDFKAKLLHGTHTIYNGKTSDEGFTTIIPSSMGKTWTYHDTEQEAIQAVNNFESKKQQIWSLKQLTDDYCSNNPWTYSGT